MEETITISVGEKIHWARVLFDYFVKILNLPDSSKIRKIYK